MPNTLTLHALTGKFGQNSIGRGYDKIYIAAKVVPVYFYIGNDSVVTIKLKFNISQWNLHQSASLGFKIVDSGGKFLYLHPSLCKIEKCM